MVSYEIRFAESSTDTRRALGVTTETAVMIRAVKAVKWRKTYLDVCVVVMIECGKHVLVIWPVASFASPLCSWAPECIVKAPVPESVGHVQDHICVRVTEMSLTARSSSLRFRRLWA